MKTVALSAFTIAFATTRVAKCVCLGSIDIFAIISYTI